jgi:transcriptional regulator with AAA-type ATPase domain/tetratricopeptide (TPR) repeat protein
MNTLGELIGESPRIVALRQQARALIARHQGGRRLAPILIQGETGTGKGLLARLMHQAGPRASGPFVHLNCAAIPETLLEAELFGYERGAFTDARHAKPGLFQVAHGGMLFLDEIGLLPRGLQAKLLSVLEQSVVRRLGGTRSEPIDVSVIAATNEPLQSAVLEGRFREDLYHRLAVLTLELPPLRDRRSDIDLLADRLLAQVCAEYGVPLKALDEGARSALKAYRWPGNVRELGNVIERAVLMSDTRTITARVLQLPGGTPGHPAAQSQPPVTADSNRDRLREALERTGGNISRTAALLGLTRNTVRARMRSYGVRPPGARDESTPVPQAASGESETTGQSLPNRREQPSPSGMRWEGRRVTLLRARTLAAPETPSAVITRALGLLIDKVHSFGGQVNEVRRHGVVAVFGHEPVEDAPRRAATAALAMLKALERERLSGALPDEVALAIAIHVERVTLAHFSGRAVIEQEATGQATAALDELEPIASFEIAVSRAAHEFLVRSFEMQPRPDAWTGSHRLLAPTGAPGGARPAGFIGRRPEIGLLNGLLDQAMLGHGQIVTLAGEPGIGKSRLLHEFEQSVRAKGVVTREGHCASYAVHVPYFPVIEILQTFCDIEETDPIETVDAKVLAALSPLGDTAVESAPYLQYLLFPRTRGELSDRSPDAIKARTFEAIRRLILAQQERRTLLLAIEDLHWIDQTSAELLAFLATTISRTRVLVVVTSRPGYRASWLAGSNATQLAVGPLSDPESRQLVASVLGTRPAGDALLARILDRGEGNPLFLEELARSIREHDDGTSAPAVPSTLHDVVAARIESLAEADKQVLEVAAVIGRETSVSLLQEAAGLSADELRVRLGRLQSGEFLDATRFGAEAEYAFKHALTHEVAYATVAEEALAPLHARVLAALLRLMPDARERRPETLAHHATAAGRHDEAIDYWYRAGQLAIKRSAHGDAIVHLTEALRLLAAQPDAAARAAQEVAMQLALATSLTAARGYAAPEVAHTLARIRELADGLADPAHELAVRWSLWRFAISRADFRAAEQLAGQLLDLADRRDPVACVAVHVAAGVDKFYLGEFSNALEHLRQALASYDREQAPAQILKYGQDMGVAAAGFLGWAEAVVGDVDAAAARADQVVRMAREIRHPFSLALALFLACEIHEDRRDPVAVRPLGEELLALAREHSYAFFSALGLMHTGWARAGSDDVPGGVVMMQEGADLFRSIGQRVGLAHRARLAEGRLAAGEVDAALAVIADALEQARETEEQAFVALHLRLRGEALLQRGDPAGAERAFQEAVDIASGQGAWLFALRAACSLARLDSRRLDVLEPITRHFPDTLDSSDLRAARALLGMAR